MVGELSYHPANDRLVYSPATGQLALNCPALYKLIPCIEEAPDVCVHCVTTDTPRWITATITGAVVCPGCLPMGPPPWSANNIVIAGLNVSVLLEHQALNPCVWENVVFGSWSYTQWTGANCTGASTPGINGTWHLSLSRGAAVWAAHLRATGPNFPTALDESMAELDDGCENIPDTPLESNGCNMPIAATYITQPNLVKITFEPGDRITPGVRCLGGSPIYTNTDLSSCVGKTIELDDGVCYRVEDNADAYISDGDVTVVDAFNDCADCCNDVNSIGFPCP